ncbi:MAG: chloramphenicol phosphotransferase CPT family protein [Oscillospiraceae bacterium]|nr:chloramphenicol phosphotransferase CPT family protein [Oscillospiraceae bacterium]
MTAINQLVGEIETLPSEYIQEVIDIVNGQTEREKTAKGKIIYLEGVSSSGKTTLARKLQARLSEPFFLLAGDMFWDMAPPPKSFENNVIFPKVESATINTLKLFPTLCINVIIDFIPVGTDYLINNFINDPYEFPALYVNVTCPIEELRRREKERGNRQIGLAESQLAELSPNIYDIIVDTHNNSTEECADKIIEMLNYPEKWTAFKSIWQQRTK